MWHIKNSSKLKKKRQCHTKNSKEEYNSENSIISTWEF